MKYSALMVSIFLGLFILGVVSSIYIGVYIIQQGKEEGRHTNETKKYFQMIGKNWIVGETDAAIYL